tara:strand:- start:10720 stop:10830 length:111 start_codon:yes stop_codon:yes gene_type:complete
MKLAHLLEKEKKIILLHLKKYLKKIKKNDEKFPLKL